MRDYGGTTRSMAKNETPFEPAGEGAYPKPGVSDYRAKYSGSRDYSIGSGSHPGRVNSNANATSGWSNKDRRETGLTFRQPI